VQSNIPLEIACTTLSNKDLSKHNFSVFPNPSTRIFNILTENPIANATIIIADLNGRIVFQTKSENLNNQTLELNQLQKGIYILKISNENFKYSQKIIKQ
jgi:hypothetical protein